jgi:hypothetical protein
MQRLCSPHFKVGLTVECNLLSSALLKIRVRAGDMAQMVELLPRKHEALRSNPSSRRRRRRRRRRRKKQQKKQQQQKKKAF